jgi:hypothetical protein
MPSSTHRNTYLERQLVELFRGVFVHLHVSGAGKALHYCTTGFAESLDMPLIALDCTLTFNPHPRLPETCEVAAIMRSIADRSQKMVDYERFFAASAACRAMGNLLVKYGRAGEGRFWRNWAGVFFREGGVRKRIELALLEARERGEVLTVADVHEQMAIEADLQEQMSIEADVHEQMSGEAEGPVEDIEYGQELNECEKSPVEEIECEQMPTEEANHQQRFMLADEQGKMPLTSTKQGKMSNKHGKRPMEVDETTCRDRVAVKRANIEHTRHVDASLSEQLDERSSDHLSLTDKTHGDEAL